MQLHLHACYGRAFLLSRPHQEVLVHCRCELVSGLRDVLSCVGRLSMSRVLCACSEKGVCRQCRPSPLCISRIYRLLASMAVLFQESSTLLCGLRYFFFSFQKMCSLSDVADDSCLILKLDVCWLYRVLNSFSVIPMYMPSLIVLVCVTDAWYTTPFWRHLPCSGHNVLFLQLHSFICSSLLFSLLRIALLWLAILFLILLMQL